MTQSSIEILDAIQKRIAQLDTSLCVLNDLNGPFMSRAIIEAVREELQTLNIWITKED